MYCFVLVKHARRKETWAIGCLRIFYAVVYIQFVVKTVSGSTTSGAVG